MITLWPPFLFESNLELLEDLYKPQISYWPQSCNIQLEIAEDGQGSCGSLKLNLPLFREQQVLQFQTFLKDRNEYSHDNTNRYQQRPSSFLWLPSCMQVQGRDSILEVFKLQRVIHNHQILPWSMVQRCAQLWEWAAYRIRVACRSIKTAARGPWPPTRCSVAKHIIIMHPNMWKTDCVAFYLPLATHSLAYTKWS